MPRIDDLLTHAAPEVLMDPSNQRPSQPFLTIGRLVAALALYVAIALVPPAPFERPLYLVRLLGMPTPSHVAVPVAGVAARDLRDSWGGPRSGGRRHEGIDIFAPRGTPVLASTDGVVWRVGTDPLGGLVVWVLGPGGQMHYYAHLDRYANERPGDRVRVGDRIGFVGSTGNARGGPPHLHYGVYTSGGAINPFPLLAPTTAPTSRTPDRRTPDRALRPESPRSRPG